MPLFMDRHDVPGATAKDAADAHVSDLEMSGKHCVEFLAYWFDAEAGGVFCFAKAPARENLEAVHRESHGLVPNEIISVAEDDVFRFLGRIHDPTHYTEVTSPVRTILFTDLQGSTALLQQVGEPEFLTLLGEHDTIIRRAVFNRHGREVKHTGDGIMAAFDDAGNALHCAVDIQRGFTERFPDGSRPLLRVRIGLASGKPVDRNDDIYGAAVVLASRICDAAQGGQILASDAVRQAADGDFRFRSRGARPLKGFPDPVPVWEVLAGPAESVYEGVAVPQQRRRRIQRWFAHARGRG
jgi:class 3 adenylate cyclase